jgi:hypothetical protein
MAIRCNKITFSKYRKFRGISLIWTAIFLLFIILIVGLALDWGKVVLVSNQLQNAADAAALAGAQLVKHGSDPNTRDRTYHIAFENYYVAGNGVILDKNLLNSADGDIVIGYYDLDTKLFYADDVHKNAVKVVARCMAGPHNPPLSLNFGPLAGVPTVNLARYAIAISSGSTGAGLITLDKCKGISTNGSKVGIDVNDGAIQINADGSCGSPFSTSSCPQITAEAFNVVAPSFSSGCLIASNFPEGIHAGVLPIPDPLAQLPEPTGTVHPNITVKNGQTITINGDSPNFAYIVNNINVNNGGTLIVNGMLFIKSGTLDVKGRIILHPPTSGTYEDVSVFQSRSNHNPASLTTSSAPGDLSEGTLYFPNNELQIQSNFANAKIGKQLIVGSLSIGGNASIIVNYDGRNPAPGFKSFLVE